MKNILLVAVILATATEGCRTNGAPVRKETFQEKVVAKSAPSELSKCALKVADDAGVWLNLSGASTLICESRWHNLNLPLRAKGKLLLIQSDLESFLPEEGVSVGGSWQIDWQSEEKTSHPLGERLFKAIKFTAEDPQLYQKWLGDGPVNQSTVVEGTLDGKLAELKEEESGIIARVEFKAKLGFKDTGRLRSRYGPNSWWTNWDLPLNGVLELDVEKGHVISLTFSGEGEIKGSYYNSPEMEESWQATITLQMRATSTGPLGSESTESVKLLIRQLGDEEYRKREEAMKKLTDVGPVALPLLRQALETTEDIETKLRLQRLIADMDE